MNSNYEVLDTIANLEYLDIVYSQFTTTEGMSFLMDDCGRVYCFDPFGEKKLTKIQDLQQD